MKLKPLKFQAEVDDVIEIFFIDEGFAFDVSHSFHLHGHAFYVLAMERHAKYPDHYGPSRKDGISKIFQDMQVVLAKCINFLSGNSIKKVKVVQMNEAGEIKRNLVNPPLKDTVMVPDGGFTLVRFRAKQGYWLLHCHMSWHNHLGMGLVLKVQLGCYHISI